MTGEMSSELSCEEGELRLTELLNMPLFFPYRNTLCIGEENRLV